MIFDIESGLRFSAQMVQKLLHPSPSPAGTVERDVWDPPAETVIEQIWNRAREFASLTGSQVNADGPVE